MVPKLRRRRWIWPQGSLQAPADDPGANAPQWGANGANLMATADNGRITSKWAKAPGAGRYALGVKFGMT
jgi:hypothetical protein